MLCNGSTAAVRCRVPVNVLTPLTHRAKLAGRGPVGEGEAARVGGSPAEDRLVKMKQRESVDRRWTGSRESVLELVSNKDKADSPPEKALEDTGLSANAAGDVCLLSQSPLVLLRVRCLGVHPPVSAVLPVRYYALLNRGPFIHGDILSFYVCMSSLASTFSSKWNIEALDMSALPRSLDFAEGKVSVHHPKSHVYCP